MEVTIPWPISTNAIWRRAGFHIHKSKRYKVFIRAVADALAAQVRYKTLTGKIEVWVALYPPNRKKYDCDNYVKSILDAFTLCGVWEDDSQVYLLHVTKNEIIKGGCAVVTVEEVQARQERKKNNARRHYSTRQKNRPPASRSLWD
ncbi:MAG: RusA family crossover junction endodeoxyribonuclease [Thermoguttaceae bacterium]|nr:RusA family crossover junction endodeoxyribonuclease [Thermoguttaceae bacterium]